MRSTNGPDDKGPDSIDARPRADSSSVARCSDADPRADSSAVARFCMYMYVADLERASLSERECEKLQGQAAEEKRKRYQLHRGKPADSEVQSQVSKDGRIQQKD